MLHPSPSPLVRMLLVERFILCTPCILNHERGDSGQGSEGGSSEN